MAKYTVHAGHAPHGKLGHGAVAYCDESSVDRVIKDYIIFWLKRDGHIAIDCTYEQGGTQSGIIAGIKKKINAEQNVTANISVHLNASKKRSKDGKTTGSECWIYPGDKVANNIGMNILLNLKRLGFTNRGVKNSTKLGVLKGIKNGGCNILVECFFCDDEDDFLLYSKIGMNEIGKAIAEGIVGHSINLVQNNVPSYIYNDSTLGRVDLTPVFNASYYGTANKDVKDDPVFGENPTTLFQHFTQFGMNEGRQGCASFNPTVYRERYSDLEDTFGSDMRMYYLHYCLYGKNEGRKGI